MVEAFKNWMADLGVAEGLAEYLGWISAGLAVIIVAWLANLIAKRVLLTGVKYFARKTHTRWDDILVERKVFTRLSHLAPALVIYYSAYLFLPVQDGLQRLSIAYMILAGVLVLNAAFNAVIDIYNTYEVSRERPIKGYVQVAKIILFVFLAIVAVSVLMDRSPWLLLSGFGAMTAVVLLVFKDSILGLVASIQLSSNDMVRIGDWIEMPKYGADGDVVDVSLHTVKIQNWDKTISTIPAYYLISDSFKNWRGMSESGGRRIKRALNIDMNSVKLCTPQMLDRFERFHGSTSSTRSTRPN